MQHTLLFEVDFTTAEVPFDKPSFIKGLEYARSKLDEKNSLEEAEAVIDEIIGKLKKEEFQSFDEALMILE